MEETASRDVEASVRKPRRARDFSRTYKACNLCRQKKTRCILDDKSAACVRCRRERRNCVFPEHRCVRDEDRAGEELQPTVSPAFKASQGRRRASHAPTATSPTCSSRIGRSMSSAVGSSTIGQDRSHNVDSPPVVTATVDGHGRTPYEPMPTSAPDIAPQEIGGDLSSDMMTTLVANGNDALSILFQAAQSDASSLGHSPVAHRQSLLAVAAAGAETSTAPMSVLQIWHAFRFVKMGWFTSEEAVQYIDFFRRNLAPLSMVSRGLDLLPHAHFKLITQEPLLCSAILLIAAKYLILPGSGGVARSILIHNRVWEHCHHLIMRIIFGQEKRSKAKTRTWGAIQALLLMVEWHPRAIHFPTGADGWDSSLLLSDFDPRDDQYGNRADTVDEFNERWRREVKSPARTFDRMAWMLLGCAQSLALELGVCDTPPSEGPSSNPRQPGRQAQQARLREMIYILVEQHSCRLGCPSSMVPGGFSGGAFFEGAHVSTDRSAAMTAWLELTSLIRMINNVLFPSSSGIRELLKTSRYVSIIRHFQEQLDAWTKKHMDADDGSYVYQELNIEFHHTRALMNSLGVQAVVDRVVGNGTKDKLESSVLNHLSITATDYDFIREVVDGSCQVLKHSVKLYEAGQLRYCPVRVVIHIITASVFLLKALSLGTKPTHLDKSLQLLEDCIVALQASCLDDMDLPARYSELLNSHLVKFKESMAPALAPQNMQFADGPFGWEGDGLGELGQPLDEWLALPFDPSFAPFGTWGDALDPSVSDDTFSAFWNLPCV